MASGVTPDAGCSVGIHCPPSWVNMQMVCRGCAYKRLSDRRIQQKADELWWEAYASKVEAHITRRREKEARRIRRLQVRQKLEVMKQQLQSAVQHKVGVQEEVEEVEKRCRRLRSSIAKVKGQYEAAMEKRRNRASERPHQRDMTEEAKKLWELRAMRIKDLLAVYPLRQCAHKHKGVQICDGLCLPMSVSRDTIVAFSEAKLSAGVGIFASAITALAEILGVPLPFVMDIKGSQSSVKVCIPTGEPSFNPLSLSSWTNLVAGLLPMGEQEKMLTWERGVNTKEVLLPLYIHDIRNVDQQTSFLQALNALNVNIVAILSSQKVKCRTHLCPSDMLLTSEPVAFTLSDCLCAMLHGKLSHHFETEGANGEPPANPVGIAWWRSAAGPRMAGTPPLLTGLYHGVATLIPEGTGGKRLATRLLATLVFAPKKEVSGRLLVGDECTAKDIWSKNKSPYTQTFGTHTGPTFTVRRQMPRSGKVIVFTGNGEYTPTPDGSAVGLVLKGEWTENFGARGVFTLHLVTPVQYTEVTPDCMRDKVSQEDFEYVDVDRVGSPIVPLPSCEYPSPPASPTRRQTQILVPSTLVKVRPAHFSLQGNLSTLPRRASASSSSPGMASSPSLDELEGWEVV